MYEKKVRTHDRRWITPFNLVVAIACIALFSLMVLPPYLSFKSLAQERALEMAVSEAQARLNKKFAMELLSGANCVEARASLNEKQIFVDPHSDGRLKNLWIIRQIKCEDAASCILHLEGAYEDVKGMEVSISVPLPTCPETENIAH